MSAGCRKPPHGYSRLFRWAVVEKVRKGASPWSIRRDIGLGAESAREYARRWR